MRQLRSITIGADPELFIINKATGKVVSSIGIIPGEKGNAYTEGMKQGFGLQIDNILAEFNVPPVALGSKKTFISNINYAKEFIRDYVKNIDKNLDIKCSASEYVDENQLQSEEALAFGCSPDYNVYTRSENEKPKGDKTNLRTTGCHIHIGYYNPDIDTSLYIVKYLDAILGIASVLIDNDSRRRQLYGKAGSFRLTSYGVEYRVLSGYFIESNETMGLMYDLLDASIYAYSNCLSLPPEHIVQDIINNNKEDLAISTLSKYYESLNVVERLLGTKKGKTPVADEELDGLDDPTIGLNYTSFSDWLQLNLNSNIIYNN